MATLRELIYDVREKYNAYSDDQNLSDDHIAFLLLNGRNMLMQQQMSNLRKPVPLEVRQVICLNFAVDSQCFDEMDVLKSTVRIPPTLENTGRSNIIRVFAPGSRFTKNINVIDYNRMPFVGADKYAKKQLFVSVDQFSNLIAYNNDGQHIHLESLQVEGVFENPEEAHNLSCEKDDGVHFWDTQFPIDSGLLFALSQQVSQELLLKYKLPLDIHNDGEDVMGAQSKPQQQPQRK